MTKSNFTNDEIISVLMTFDTKYFNVRINKCGNICIDFKWAYAKSMAHTTWVIGKTPKGDYVLNNRSNYIPYLMFRNSRYYRDYNMSNEPDKSGRFKDLNTLLERVNKFFGDNYDNIFPE